MGSPALSAGLATLLRSATVPSGPSLPPPVAGSIAAKMALGATRSRSPAMLPATSLPNTLWPLLKVIVPEMSGPDGSPFPVVAAIPGNDAIDDIKLTGWIDENPTSSALRYVFRKIPCDSTVADDSRPPLV